MDLFDGLDFGDDFFHHGFDAIFKGRPAVRTIAAGTRKLNYDDHIIGEFHEIDITAVLLKVGTYLFEDVFDFAEDDFFIHIFVLFFAGIEIPA